MESSRVGAALSYAAAVATGVLIGLRLREQALLVTVVALAALAVFCGWQILQGREMEALKTSLRLQEGELTTLRAQYQMLGRVFATPPQQQTTPLPTSQ